MNPSMKVCEDSLSEEVPLRVPPVPEQRQELGGAGGGPAGSLAPWGWEAGLLL